MVELIILDAVSVATISRAARDAAAKLESKTDPAIVALSMLPECVSAILRHSSPTAATAMPQALIRYAVELDQIAEATLLLDQREHELEHQLLWWAQRITTLESQLAEQTATDIETGRELALFRGRVSGAHAMLRHYVQERSALAGRHESADTACAEELAAV